MRAPITINAGNDDFPKYGDATLRHAGGMAQLQQEYANRLFAGAAETEAKRQQQERAYEVENQMLDKKLANAAKIASMRGASATANGLPGNAEVIDSTLYAERSRSSTPEYMQYAFRPVPYGKNKVLYVHDPGWNTRYPAPADMPITPTTSPLTERGVVAPPPAIPSTPQPAQNSPPPGMRLNTAGSAPSPSVSAGAAAPLMIRDKNGVERTYEATPDGLREIK